MKGPRELAAAVGSGARAVAGALRRMAITRTTSALWQIAGHRLLDGDTETRDAEAFTGVGFYARPASGEDTEAIVAFPGAAGAGPVVIATRQEAIRREVAGDLADDETQIHNSSSVVRIKASGAVEVRSAGGTAVALATKADLEALRSWIATHTHTGVTTGGGTSLAPSTPPPTPAGTSILKGE